MEELADQIINVVVAVVSFLLGRLTKHDDGTEKCVACFMCATACPAECIFIEAEERFDGVDEKRPKELGS